MMKYPVMLITALSLLACSPDTQQHGASEAGDSGSEPVLFSPPKVLPYVVDVAAPMAELSARLEPDAVRTAANMVADWQIRHADDYANSPLKNFQGFERHSFGGWLMGAMAIGMTRWGMIDGNDKYLEFIRENAREFAWGLESRIFDADDYVIGQTYLELYRLDRDPDYLGPLKERLNHLYENWPTVNNHSFGEDCVAMEVKCRERWTWIDALFMGAPVWIHMGNVTGDKRYIEYGDHEYWTSFDTFWDEEEGLLYRDRRYIPMRDKLGEKVFWGRGNGWVYASFGRILPVLPVGHPSRDNYIEKFRAMSASLARRQQDDGSWPSSLTSPNLFPGPENSGSAFFTYGMAWGINQGILDRDTYLPVVQKAWQSLTDSIYPMVREAPWPASGKVEVNSPWFLWSPIIAEKRGFDTYRYNPGFLYKGRLSMEADFSGPSTYVSPLREWTFFNRHQSLEKGTWYWQYATVNKQTQDEAWSDPIAFTISGEERQFVIPDFTEIKKKIPASHPRILADREEIGKLAFPEPDRSRFIEKIRTEIDAKLPESLIYADQTVLAKKRIALDDAGYFRFIDKRTKEIYRSHKRRLESIIKAYLITGETIFREAALKRFDYLEAQYRTIVEQNVSNDFTDGYFINISTSIYDNFYDFLTPEQRNIIRQRLVDVQRDTYERLLHHPELTLFNSHTWQKHLTTFMLTSLTLMHEVPEADTWFEYVYNLWSMRAPAMGDDGGWAPGNGYFDANKETLIVMPVILGRLTGVNYFDHPWYRGAGAYFLYTATPGHIAGGFGDNADVKRENAADFIEVYSRITGDAYGQMYTDIVARLGEPESRGVPAATDNESTLPIGLSENENLYWYMNRALPQWRHVRGPAEISKAKAFAGTGAVGMHSHIDQPDKNLSLVFRSSPFGGVGHTQASQNAFNVQFGGEPLFFRTGYYSSWADPHSLLSYRHTRAHNSILVDGKGQPFTPSGYGWIARFASGQRLAYALGDASNAYSGFPHRDSVTRMLDRWQFALDETNGFGDPGLTRFRRHIAMMDDLVVIYDELAAEAPVQWSWLVKSRTGLSVDGNVYTATNSKGQGKLWLYSNGELQSEVTDQFFSPPVDWLGNGAKRGVEYGNQRHGSSKTGRCQRSRFLAVIKAGARGESLGQPQAVSEGKLVLDGWTISAELDAEKPAALNIARPGVGAVDFGRAAVAFDGAEYPRDIPGSTVILEVGEQGISREEVVDKLPSAAIYQ